MAFRETSNWNRKSEMEAFLIFKQLEEEEFPRGKQIDLCRQMSKRYDLTEYNISAKVGNYKSEANINNASNSSKETIKNYKEHKNLSVQEIRSLIENM